VLPILFINLDSDGARRERMEAEFSRLGLTAERFAATRWTELPETEQARFYSAGLNSTQFHKPLVAGEKGCYTSHLLAWNWLLASKHPAMVLLEDDVALRPEFGAVISAIEQLPAGWDMIKLIGREHEKLSAARQLTAGFELVDYLRVPSLTAGYVISRSGAKKLLDSRIPFGRPVDVDLRYWWESGLKVQGVMPAAISLDDTSLQSSIGAKAAASGLVASWRKFRIKAAYSLLNRWHQP
jgi:glycosyl transferase family 25